MAAGTIKIRLDADGKVHTEVNGCEGSVCEDLTNVLIGGLGEVEEHVLKLEHGIQERPDYVTNLEGDGNIEE